MNHQTQLPPRGLVNLVGHHENKTRKSNMKVEANDIKKEI